MAAMPIVTSISISFYKDVLNTGIESFLFLAAIPIKSFLFQQFEKFLVPITRIVIVKSFEYSAYPLVLINTFSMFQCLES